MSSHQGCTVRGDRAARGLLQAGSYIEDSIHFSTGCLTTGAIIYLIFIFKASFPFYLNKFSLKGDFYYCHKWKISIAFHR